MKRDIENKFIELLHSLSIVAEQLTIAENNYLTDGKWDIEKIKEQPFTVIHDENTKDNLIDLYKKELGYFKNIEDELDLLEINNLIAEIETNLQSSMHPNAYIKGLLLKIVEVMGRVKDYTKNKYSGGLAIAKLENLKRAFLYNLNVLCIGFDIDIAAILREFDNNVSQSPKAGRQNQNENTDKQPSQIIFSDKLLNLLQENGFIENTTMPYKWIAVNKKSKGAFYNKKSLLDLLCLLEYSDDTIKNRLLLNSYFNFPNAKPLLSQHYTLLISKNGNIIRPIVSEYHTELEEIANKSKEK